MFCYIYLLFLLCFTLGFIIKQRQLTAHNEIWDFAGQKYTFRIHTYVDLYEFLKDFVMKLCSKGICIKNSKIYANVAVAGRQISLI